MSTGKTSPGPCEDCHCWKCHVEVQRTTSRCLCFSCCDALEGAECRELARSSALIASAPTLSRKRDEAVELLREEFGWGPGDGPIPADAMNSARCECSGKYVCWNHRVFNFLRRIDGAAIPAPPSPQGERPR